MIHYNDEDIIITDINKIMSYAESVKYCALVYRVATKKESDEYRTEMEYWGKQEEQQQHEGSYHELSN